MLILFLMIINYYFLLVASFELTDEELLLLKKDIKPEKLKKFIQFGITFLVELLLDDETSSACYRDYPYMAECAEDELESIAPLIGRSCFKKCEEYEIEEGNICYSCKDGSKIINREAIYGDKDITLFNCKFQELPNARVPEKVKNSHCMANTIKIGELCYKDCSLLGLKPFEKFCAKDENDYKHFFIDQFVNFFKYSIKTVTSYFLDKIFGKNDDITSFADNFLILFKKIELINTKNMLSGFIKSVESAKNLLKKIGKNNLLKKVTSFLKSLTKDIEDDIIEKVIDFFENHIERWMLENNLKEIIDNKRLNKAFNEAFQELKGTFDFSIDAIYECQLKNKDYNLDECFDSIMNIIESLDPTYWVGFIREMFSLVPTTCDIDVKPEHSKKLLMKRDDKILHYP